MISHPPNKGYDSKPLSSHLKAVAAGCRDEILRLDMDLTLISQESLAAVAYQTGILHDIGKASSHFQNMIRGSGCRSPLSRHSMISALYTYTHLQRQSYPAFIPPLAFKLVQRHHGNLDSLSALYPIEAGLKFQLRDISVDMCFQVGQDNEMTAFLNEQGICLQPFRTEQIDDMLYELSIYDFCQRTLEDSIELFIIGNLLFSVLIEYDKFDAARLKIQDYSSKVGKLNFDPQRYIETQINRSREDDLNSLRDQFMAHVRDHPEIEPGKRLYTITAPTGIGKTMACMTFANVLLKKTMKPKRVIYCLPFTSIIDQNYDIYKNLLFLNHPEIGPDKYKYILKHHHLEDYYQLTKDEPDYDYWDYLNDNLIAESWSSACIISTFVQFFHSVIGYRNSMLRKMHHIINSLIILDEIQSLSGSYYLLMRALFSVLSQRFSTHILLCTATQPLIFEPDSYVEIGLEGLFQEDVFNRVSLMIHRESFSENDLRSFISGQDFKNLLIVVNTKKTAVHLYESLSEQYEGRYDISCLTTLQLPAHRLAVINEIRDKLKQGITLILVSTQLIEAGVDISFHTVVRDIAPLDSIVQVAGRCNRNNEYGTLGGTMHVVNILDDNGRLDCQKVYDKYLLDQTRGILAEAMQFESKQMFELTKRYYASLNLSAISQMILTAIKDLNYSEEIKGQIPISRFQIIQEDYPRNTVYILATPEIDDTFQSLLELKKTMRQPVLNKSEQEYMLMLAARTYNLLNPYRLSLSDSELMNYSTDQKILNKFESIYYIRLEDIAYCYSEKKGFLYEPLPFPDGVFL